MQLCEMDDEIPPAQESSAISRRKPFVQQDAGTRLHQNLVDKTRRQRFEAILVEDYDDS